MDRGNEMNHKIFEFQATPEKIKITTYYMKKIRIKLNVNKFCLKIARKNKLQKWSLNNGSIIKL